jgi:SAM-dependent methyltransferase
MLDCAKSVDYPIVSNQPILVDFASSILEREKVLVSGAESLVPRATSRLRSMVRRWVFGENRVAGRHAQTLLDHLRQECPSQRPLILVIGGGTIGTGADKLHASPEVVVVAFDVYASPHTTFVADAHAIPFIDSSVNAVWVQAVLEHVLFPQRVIDEIHRVLKPSGLVYAETPFLQPVHEGAFDYTRFTESGHRWLFRWFESIDSGVVAGPGTTLFWSVRYFFSGLLRSRRLGTIAALPFFWLRFCDYFVDRHHASDAASGVYFLGRRSEREMDTAEIISFFGGVR